MFGDVYLFVCNLVDVKYCCCVEMEVFKFEKVILFSWNRIFCIITNHKEIEGLVGYNLHHVRMLLRYIMKQYLLHSP